MDRGALVPDELVIDMLVERTRRAGRANGLRPRWLPAQPGAGEALDEALASEGKTIDLALNIAVPDEELVKRLSGRWICRNCGAIYHEITNPPARRASATSAAASSTSATTTSRRRCAPASRSRSRRRS